MRDASAERPMSGVQPRMAAVRAIDAVLHRGRSLKAELGVELPKLADPRDRALVEAIVMAALREHGRYAEALNGWMTRPPGKRDGALRALLYAGFAQLDAMRLPAHAAVDATVETARGLGRGHQSGLINALLRRALREPLPAPRADAAWPRWLAEHIRVAWPDDAEAVFAASAQPPPMWLRVNRRRIARAAYAERLADAGIAPHPSPDMDDAIRLDTPLPVEALPGFATGEVSVQDGSAQRVADALAPPVATRVLDACAAPGGKAAHLAERHPGARVLALDTDARRVRRMEEGFARLGLCVESRVADATAPDRWWNGEPFGAIVIDAPCSATGIVRRQPDVLLHRRETDIAALVALQARLLDALWPLLESGGSLLYATCSILAVENARQIEAFLARTPEARLKPLDARFGRDTGFGHQRLPGEDGMDGFFYARLARD
ncbi:16S rRNA (cytosine(967)-C(5))-methyltransferase RsmB [Lysobacter pythonis]|uniref:16S rRNA (cytosine(967)-C(5))-methyltransferase n=1 Tax=Solilutibacter pythonis TaxID=2483112 RepID=A0A3M2HP24_9GAMM|nr:16S rRNA (cytosine(967)-C(5))-methyltransferase RsmB [Lysobacter pythonis]RMH89079.1 16S rRNA (cytosine(967)-C(5))-methyltransferase RsmB [Lysobacter pythonis]